MEYATIPVATVVGGTLKLSTMPPSATGNDATLKDMIAWPSAMAIIGTQDCCASARPIVSDAVVMIFLSFWPCGRYQRPSFARLLLLRLRDEQIHSKSLRQEFRDKLPLYAVAGGVKRRCKRSQTSLAR